jgi:hypothetical protein
MSIDFFGVDRAVLSFEWLQFGVDNFWWKSRLLFGCCAER